MFKLFKSSLVAAVIAVAALAAAPASAVKISGDVSFNGGFTPNGSIGTGGTATAIDFDPNGAGGLITVTQSDGDFAANGVVNGTTGSIQDFTFAPFAGPIAGFWTLGIFSFQLDNITSTSFFTAGGQDFLVLTGTGIISAAGFDDTAGSWSFSGNRSGSTFSFSASSGAIPEPATLALIGAGLLGLGVARRRKAMA